MSALGHKRLALFFRILATHQIAGRDHQWFSILVIAIPFKQRTASIDVTNLAPCGRRQFKSKITTFRPRIKSHSIWIMPVQPDRATLYGRLPSLEGQTPYSHKWISLQFIVSGPNVGLGEVAAAVTLVIPVVLRKFSFLAAIKFSFLAAIKD